MKAYRSWGRRQEYTPTGWLAHTYDELGNRVSTTISGEHTIDWLHYGSGHVHQIRFDGAAVADIERDDLHSEVLRTQCKLTSHVRGELVRLNFRIRTRFSIIQYMWAECYLITQSGGINVG